MGQRLANAARSPVTRLWIDHADHNDLFEVGNGRITAAVARFISDVAGD
jgi:hypothetical protein